MLKNVFFCAFPSNFIRIFFSWYVQRMWKYSSCELVYVFKLFKNIFLIYLEYIKNVLDMNPLRQDNIKIICRYEKRNKS